MKLSIVIPVRNEEKGIRRVLEALLARMQEASVPCEVLVVNDRSTDGTVEVVRQLSAACPQVHLLDSPRPHGFGLAIRKGFESMKGEAVVVYMGDGSDDPEDVLLYYRTLQQGFDCVFGSRFIRGSRVSGYPWLKLFLNRMGNKFIQMLFLLPYNDVSNAFKAYRAPVIKAVQPLVSQYFNITVEVPLKAIVRGFSYTVVPIRWNGRESGVSKYRIKELSRKYFFSILYVWLEKILLKEELVVSRSQERTKR